jgi:hydrogenase maturation protein HypF
MAVAWADAAGGTRLAERAALTAAPDDEGRTTAVLDLVGRGQGIATSSAGRLFDAVAALAGVRERVTYEGQAAIELEALAERAGDGDGGTYDYSLRVPADGAPLVLDPGPTIAAVVADLDGGTSPSAVARRFHDTVALATADTATRLAGDHGCDTVALSGGVFQNAILSRSVARLLGERGLHVLVHRVIPPNDGGISVGQAAVAAATDRLATASDW